MADDYQRFGGKVIGSVNKSEVDLREARYDAVLHLVTAADGAELHYTTENNQTRTESPDQARDMDARSQKVCNYFDFGLQWKS